MMNVTDDRLNDVNLIAQIKLKYYLTILVEIDSFFH